MKEEVIKNDSIQYVETISLRDYFAARAMEAMIS